MSSNTLHFFILEKKHNLDMRCWAQLKVVSPPKKVDSSRPKVDSPRPKVSSPEVLLTQIRE